jgi:hypothetical protein
VGPLHPGLCNIFEITLNKTIMIDVIPYFGALVTIIFSIAFYWGLQEIKKLDE